MSVQLLQKPTLADRFARSTDLSETRHALSACLETVCAWIVRRAERRALRELAEDRRLLSDIGLTREQVLDEASKPFWHA